MLKDAHGNKVKFFGRVLAVISGLFVLSVLVAPILFSLTDRVMSEALESIKEGEKLSQEVSKSRQERHEEMYEYYQERIVESKEDIEKSKVEILRHKDRIEFYKDLIISDGNLIESYNNMATNARKKIEGYELQIKNLEKKLDASDPKSKTYRLINLYKTFCEDIKKTVTGYEKTILKSKAKIKDHEKYIIGIEDDIKDCKEWISRYEKDILDSENYLRENPFNKQSSEQQLRERKQEREKEIEDLEKLVGSRVKIIYTPMNVGILIFNSLSMILFFIIAKSWMAKDPFSKSVIFSFRFLGILWISHSIFTGIYFMKVSLDPNNLELLTNQVSADSQLLPNFGNIDSLIAGILFLCLSYIIDHGSKMLEDTSLTI
ncbi:hypothetical protein PQO01_08670 [Lentisphaera marina]|uniref:hypothetical protein n=1 Tax=Lentisphaera marina TaxID=1111041 RepID=UPI002366E1FB|nr:hypothetical protein [Lentisphaera marina]MDD7985018.1 hypothetical protein [Lentisphaera marina]